MASVDVSSVAGGGGGSSPSVASSRCAQAECIASRNELDLCKRDLDELEREHDQLHDQLAQKESECGNLTQRLQQSEQEVARITQRQHDQLGVKDAEIKRLQSAVEEMTTTLQTMRQQQDLQSGRDVKETGAAASSGSVEAVLRSENATLHATVKELRGAISRETSASAHANQQTVKIQQESKDKRDELYQALKENDLLRREQQERDAALEKVSQLALDYETALRVLHDQQRDYLEALDEMRIDNTQQCLRIEQLEREKEDIEAKLIEMDEHESQVDVVVRELKMKHDVEKAVLRAEIDELRKKGVEWKQNEKLRMDYDKTKSTSEMIGRGVHGGGDLELEELEKQLEMVHDLRVQDRLALDEKDREIQQLRSDVESLVEHLQEGGSETRQAVQRAVEAESQKHKATDQGNAALKRRLKEQGGLVEQLELRQAQLENDLVEAQEWNAKYEAGAGLEDVMRYQKKLRRELEKQQLANQKLRQELNDQRDATDKLHIAFDRLKADAGKDADFEYDDLAIDEHLKGELAVQQAVMTQMEHQLHELENERIRLLQKLRDQARVVGGKLYETHGLTTDQWLQVEDFIERVKLTPEVAKRWLSQVESTAAPANPPKPRKESAGSHEREELQRLRNDNMRLREELQEASFRAVVVESHDAAAEQIPIQTVSRTDKKNAATSPMNKFRGHTTPDALDKADSSSERKDEDRDNGEKAVNANDANAQEKTHRQFDQLKHEGRANVADGHSAETLAQAIASALESRLQFIHDSSIKTSHATSRSVATQPSPAKTSVMDNSRLAFETENELSQQVDFLREFQLLLDDYVKLEGQNETLRAELSLQETTCKSLMDQQNVVYQHFFHLQDASTTEKAKLQFDMQQLKAQTQEFQLKCQRYEATVYTIESSTACDTDDAAMRLRAELVELTRRVAHDEVNSAKLKRDHVLLQEEYRLSLADLQTLESDWLEMERVLKFRILYLESWKSGAEDLMARTDATLDKCVLKIVADQKHTEFERLLDKHVTLSEEFAELHAKYLKVYELPAQLSKLVHENAMLVAERAARQGDSFVSMDAVSQSRITQLQGELDQQVETVKSLEDKLQALVVASTARMSAPSDAPHDRSCVIESENKILCERINEVEQLYESLVRDHEKAKQDAELAASQAHTLSRKVTQEKTKLADKEDQLRDLMAATEDHAIVARLQQQLIHIKSNYQQFLVKYDNVVADQQQASLMRQHAELELENHAKTQNDAREKARSQILVLETALQELKERDYVVRNTKWEAFKKRLDGLEAEMRTEQDRRRALEKDLEERQAMLPHGSGTAMSASVASAAEISRLKSRIDSLETRERVLMGQLDVLGRNATVRSSPRESGEETRLRSEVGELKRLHGEMMHQLQSIQVRNAELFQLNNDLETQKRLVQREKDDLEIDYQQVHAQWQLQGGHRSGGGNQAESHSSPIMRKKVGLYEKDHLEQQQAAQVSIASLKQLLTEKNSVIAEYQKKITTLRADVVAGKAQERVDATQLHKTLYDENQRMIARLKEATDKIYHLEKTGSDKKALKAAQDRHEYVLQEWKRVEIELEATKSKVRELEMEILSVINERDVAEARAGEALEEIVLNQDKITGLEKVKKVTEDQLLFVKRDMAKREEKMQLLREAIIKLKEEFLKAEDRHAIELAKAQNVVRNTKQSKSETERDRDQWSDEKEQLEAQVQMLQEKMALARKEEGKAKSEVAKLTKQQKQIKTRKAARNGDGAQSVEVDQTEPKRSSSVLEAEVERLKTALKERVVGEARMVEELEKKIKVLQAQNLALRESSGSAPSGAASSVPLGEGTTAGKGSARQLVREQWEGEKRLQRRVDVVTMRLKEKQAELEKNEKECERLREKLNESETKLKEMQRVASSAREAIQGNTDASAGGNALTSRARRAAPDADELKRQNAFLQETLMLKRKEWEESFQEQMEKYEEQLHRLRSRLAQRHRGDHDNLSHLEREERDFVATDDVREELISLGNELREKERLLVDKDTRLMELELEVEGLRVEYQRLHRKAASAKSSKEALPSTAPSTRRIKSSAQERLELEEVIENMKKVIEKLRSENEKLRKAAAAVISPDKVDAMRKKLKEVRDARQGLQVEVDQLRLENSELKKDKLRLQQRVRSLSASRTDSSGTRGVSPRKSTDDDTERLHQLQLAEKDAQIADLTNRIVKKDTYIRELGQRLAQAETQSIEPSVAEEVETKTAELRSRVDELVTENEQLRHELSAFDQDFFEEIEDLKYKYAQAVRDKQRLERMRQGGSN